MDYSEYHRIFRVIALDNSDLTLGFLGLLLAIFQEVLYIEILELMFIFKRDPAYLKNKAKRQAITMHKHQTIDMGLPNSQLRCAPTNLEY